MASTILSDQFVQLPAGTTAERPATPTDGMIRKNTTTGYVEYWDTATSNWLGIGAFAASGGNVTTSGGYTYHTFTSSGTFTVISGQRSANVLIVGAGGGGGSRHGGGGGAGGYIAQTMTLTAGNYTITVGAGGAPGVADCLTLVMAVVLLPLVTLLLAVVAVGNILMLVVDRTVIMEGLEAEQLTNQLQLLVQVLLGKVRMAVQ